MDVYYASTKAGLYSYSMAQATNVLKIIADVYALKKHYPGNWYIESTIQMHEQSLPTSDYY